MPTTAGRSRGFITAAPAPIPAAASPARPATTPRRQSCGIIARSLDRRWIGCGCDVDGWLVRQFEIETDGFARSQLVQSPHATRFIQFVTNIAHDAHISLPNSYDG